MTKIWIFQSGTFSSTNCSSRAWCRKCKYKSASCKNSILFSAHSIDSWELNVEMVQNFFSEYCIRSLDSLSRLLHRLSPEQLPYFSWSWYISTIQKTMRQPKGNDLVPWCQERVLSQLNSVKRCFLFGNTLSLETSIVARKTSFT